jgi:hypothetical protein
MKKITTTKNTDWKKTMTESTEEISASLSKLISFLQKNKRTINKEIKLYGGKASGVNELFEKLTIELDTKISEAWDIIED